MSQAAHASTVTPQTKPRGKLVDMKTFWAVLAALVVEDLIASRIPQL